MVVAKLSLGTSVIINWLKYSLKSSLTIMWKPDLKVMHPVPSGILTSRLTTFVHRMLATSVFSTTTFQENTLLWLTHFTLEGSMTIWC